ncbi:tripartite tricarboxylate transporter substrate binding protein [Ramlibacter sp. AN1015]|uniref:tripartite tricarboxylate transporter substrate binding protein n=1 Tax=Ramlibacter sp. AN1015 TaxID=3133428 RepID=UPI0030C10821
MFKFAKLAACSLIAASLTTSAVAQARYPSKPIRFVVGFAAGGASDVVARTLSESMGNILGQPIIVDNKPGADSLIATQFVAGAEPDGYTVMVGVSSHAINASLYTNSKVDPVKDFAPIGMIGDSPNLLVVHPSVQARTTEELIELAKSKPTYLNYGSSASITMLATELFSDMAGIKMTRIPYKGSGQAVPAVMAGDVQVLLSSAITLLPHVQTGKVRPLAITSARRSPLAPDVPTVTEKALPGYVATTWYALFAPAGTPTPVVTQLNAALNTALANPATAQKLQAQGVDITPSTPAELQNFVQKEVVKWAKVVKDTGTANAPK